MTEVQRQVERVRQRLWLRQWVDHGTRAFEWAVWLLAASALILRAIGLNWPVLPIVGGLVLVAVVVSLISSLRSRPDSIHAAAVLDEAADLRERTSSAMLCDGTDDPFVNAVRADAERRVQAIKPSQCVPWRKPRALGRVCVAVVVLALVFLVPTGFLNPAEGVQQRREQELTRTTKAEIKKQLTELKKIVRTNPALADLQPDLEQLDKLPADGMDKPTDVRQAALKKIDRLADAVRDKQGDEKFERLGEMKRMLRTLREPQGQKSPVNQLSRQLASGDFKAAKQTMTEMKEQLATLKKEQDREMVENLSKQLDQLSKQLDQLAKNEQLRKKLEQAGIKKEDAERMLQQLTKKDLDQMKKQLQKNGLDQKKIEKLAKELQKQQDAAQMINKLGQAMKQGAQSGARGDGQGMSAALDQAGEQMDAMESLEQEMNQLQSMAAAADDAMKKMGNACSNCSGDGCSSCNGKGGSSQGRGGMGKQAGQGRGGRAESEQTAVDFKIERGKVETTKGKIIGQFLVDGQQVKGEATDDFVEMIAAAQREAKDTVSRDRIPRQYQKAVRDYFDRLPADLGVKSAASTGAAPSDTAPSDKAPADESANGDAPSDASVPDSKSDEGN